MGLHQMPQQLEKLDLVKKKIVAYFQKYPNAADSLEGISKFWLNDLESSLSQDDLENILKQLIEDGVVKKSVRNLGGSIYSSAFANIES